MIAKIFGLVAAFVVAVAANEPAFENNVEDITAEEGSNVAMSCIAQGDTPMTFEWYDQFERRIHDNETVQERNFSIENLALNGSILKILSVSKMDEGIYTCTARNKHGLSSKLFRIQVNEVNYTDEEIATVDDIKVLNVTANSVLFDISRDRTFNYIDVEYAEGKDYKSVVKWTSLRWYRGVSYEATGLIPGGRYHFRFMVAPSNDSRRWSKPLTMVLLPEVPEVVLLRLDAGNIKVQWIRMFDDIMRGTIDKHVLSYYVVQMVGGNSWEKRSCEVAIEVPSCFGTQYTISGLSRNVFYEINLRAHTAAGFGKPYVQKISLS